MSRKILLTLFLMAGLNWGFSQVWTELAGPYGGTIVDYVKDASGNLFLIADCSGVFKSTDGGTTWVKSGLNQNCLSDLYRDGANLYAVDSYRVYKSTDGVTWTALNNNNPYLGSNPRLIKNPVSGSFFIVSSYGVFKSTDSAVTWTKVFDSVGLFGGQAKDIIIKSTGDIFITTDDGIYKSLNPSDGLTASWQTADSGIIGSPYVSGIAYDGSGNLYCASEDNVYKSTNNGVVWSSIKGTLAQTGFRGKIQVSATNTIFVLNEQNYVIHKSTNGGSTWTTINPPANYAFEFGLLVVDDNNLFASSWQQGVLKTINGGTSWTFPTQGITALGGEDLEVASNGNILWNPTRNGVYRSVDNGATWVLNTTTPLDADFYDMLQTSDGTIYMTGSTKILKTSDGGATWITQNAALPTTFPFIITNDDTNFYTWGNDGKIYKSPDKGVTWGLVTVTGLPASYSFYKMVVTQDGSLYVKIYNQVTSKYEIWKISSGAATQKTIPLTNWDDMETIGNNIFLRDYSRIYKSSDGAVTWKDISNGINGYWLNKTADGALITHGDGVAVTRDAGVTWTFVASPGYWIGGDVTVNSAGVVFAKANNSAILKTTSTVVPLTAPSTVSFTWQHLSGPYGGFMQSMTKDGLGNVYAFSNNSELYKLASGSASWQRLSPVFFSSTNWYNPQAITVGSGNRLIATTYSDILFSSDAGVTWSRPTYNTYFYGGFRAVRESGSNLWVAGYGVWLSTDNGVNWTQKRSQADYINGMEINSLGHLYILTTNGVEKSIDNGLNWTVVTSGIANPTGYNVNSLAIDAGNNVYACTYTDVYKTTNGGTNWSSIKGSLTDSNFSGGSLSLQGSDVYFSTSGKLYKSTDAGATWTALSIPNNFGVSALVVSGSSLYINRWDYFQENMFVTTNGGSTWNPISTGITNTGARDLHLSVDGKIFVGDGGCGMRKSSDNGATWPQLNISPAVGSIVTLSDGSLLAYGCSLQKSTDNGANWVQIGSASIYNLRVQDDNTYYYYDNTQFNKSTNGGTSWTVQPVTGLPTGANDYFNSYDVSATGDLFIIYHQETPWSNDLYKVPAGSSVASKVALGFTTSNVQQVTVNNGKIYTMVDNHLYRSSDGGTTWSGFGPYCYSFYIDPAGKMFTMGNNFAFLMSLDGGTTFQNVGEQGTNFSNAIIHRDGFAYATTWNAGVLKSSSVVLPNDNTAPVASTLLPADNSTTVLLNSNFEITFDEVTNIVAGKNLFLYQVGIASPVATVNVSALTLKGNKYVFDPPTNLTSDKDYYINIDAGAFTDIFGNAFAGITNNSDWNFKTIKETDPPVITHTPNNLDKPNTSLNLTVSITDASVLAYAKVFYRGIASSGSWTLKTLNATTGSQDFTLSASDYDAMGIEYYFEAADNIGNGIGLASTTYYSYISAQTSNQVTIPNLKFGGTVKDWQIITIPHELQNRNLTNIFDELGPYDPEKWRVVRYKDGNSWSEFGKGFSTMEKGQGYFINIASTATVKIDNSVTPNFNEANPYVIPLGVGWNQIGNPYVIPINWPFILDQNGGAPGVGSLVYYNDGYKGTNELTAFQGAFVQSTTSANLVIPIKGQPSGRMRNDFSRRLESENWKVDFVLTQGTTTYDMGAVGMHPDAEASRDRFDQGTPPRFLDYLEMNFNHPEFFLSKFTQDIVPTTSEYVWNFEVNAEHDGSTEIRWDNLAFAESSVPFYLVDPTGVQVVDMRKNNRYSFGLESGTRKFEIYYGKEPLASAFRVGSAFPTPFRSDVKIPFSLPSGPQPYQVSVEVFNNIGQRVGVVANGVYSSGYQEISWDGSAPDGSNLNGGLYFFTLVAHSPSGSQKLSGKLIKNN